MSIIKRRRATIPIKRDVVDKDTGEVTSVPDELVVSHVDFGNWFKMTSIDSEVDMMPLDSLGTPFIVFYVILKRVVWEECTVDIGVSAKMAITRVARIKNGMIKKYLDLFCKGKLMKKISRDSYMVNPQFFFIGDEKTQYKMFLKYEAHGRKI